MFVTTDYGRPMRKPPSLHGRKSTPTPTFLDIAEPYCVCQIGPNFQISLIYAFIGYPQCPDLVVSVVSGLRTDEGLKTDFAHCQNIGPVRVYS